MWLSSVGFANDMQAVVYDRNNSVVYNAQTPPVDMSLPLHQALQQRFPGGHMVFGAGTDCPVAQPQTIPLVRNTTGTSPLLTDRATAQAMGLPHTVLAGNVALVAQRPDSMSPGLVVAQAAVDPAEAALRTLGGPPAARPAAGGGAAVLIMQLHEQPRPTCADCGA